MRKLIYILPVALLALGACSREEANLFDDTAAERLIKARGQAITYLTEATNWEMRYFAQPETAGYAFLFQFNIDGSVKIGAKNHISSSDRFKTEVSLWDVDYTQSVTLSFNSYNSLFSIFADPLSDGIGYGGDYEFVILESAADHFRLKGKKTGAYIDLIRLEDNIDWEMYYTKIDEFNDMTFTGNDEAEFTYIGYDTIMTMTYEGGVFSYNRNDADTTLGFVVTPTGVHFYSQTPTVADVLSKDFILSPDTSKLICADDEAVYFVSEFTPADFFASKFNKDARWTYVPDGTDAATHDAVADLMEEAEAKGAVISRISYSRLASYNAQGKKKYSYILLVNYTVEGKLFQGYLNLTYTNMNGQVKFAYKNADASILPLLYRIDADPTVAAERLADIFCDTFVPSSYSGSKLNMVEMTLTSTTDDTKVIHVLADTKSR